MVISSRECRSVDASGGEASCQSRPTRTLSSKSAFLRERLQRGTNGTLDLIRQLLEHETGPSWYLLAERVVRMGRFGSNFESARNLPTYGRDTASHR